MVLAGALSGDGHLQPPADPQGPVTDAPGVQEMLWEMGTCWTPLLLCSVTFVSICPCCSCSVTWCLASKLELLPTCMGRAFGKQLSM